jgi:FkbM family methyltransferase
MKNLARLAAQAIFGKLLPKKAYPVISGHLRGAKFVLGTLEGEGGGGSVYFNLVEPEQTEIFAKNLDSGDVFFDVGANVGYYTVLGSRLVGERGQIVSFEPLVRNLSHLYRHVTINKLQNVSIIPSACSDKISLESFSSGQNTAMGYLTNEDKLEKNSVSNNLTLVSTVTLDAVAERLKIVPKVIKIDVEGAELSVLRGARETVLPAKPKIFLSLHSENLRTECLEYLKGFGYEFEPLGEDKENTMEFLCSVK